MTQLSKHFKRAEFACRCNCGQDTVDAGLLTVLEKVREHFGVPVTVNSGNRCKAYNTQVGGANKSQHLISRAADITIEGIDSAAVYAWIDGWHVGGLGSYATFTHIDSRKHHARWNG